MSSQLQNLSEQFNTLLTQYRDTYKNYINVINSNDTSLTSVPNSSFFGETNIKNISNISLDNCQIYCSENTLCSGATFNNTSNNCSLSSGTGDIGPTQNSTAIVKEAIYYSYQLQNINNQLMNINKQIMQLSQNNYDQYQQNKDQVQQQNEAINNNYEILSQEKEQINVMIRQFETINSAYENGSIMVTSNYYNFILLFIIVIFLIFLFIKVTTQGEQMGGGNNYSFIPFIFVIFIVAIFILINSKDY
jgi:NADH:ubiquinone oxidoreductase subunit 3 (subunit A)